MPVRPPTPDTIKAEILWTQSGIPAANILHVGYDSGAPDAVDLASLATALSNAIKGAIQGQYGADTVCTGVTCTDIASDSGHVGSDVASWAGTGAGDNLSASREIILPYNARIALRRLRKRDNDSGGFDISRAGADRHSGGQKHPAA